MSIPTRVVTTKTPLVTEKSSPEHYLLSRFACDEQEHEVELCGLIEQWPSAIRHYVPVPEDSAISHGYDRTRSRS